MKGVMVKESYLGKSTGVVEHEMNVQDLPSGIYFLQITAENINKTQKIIKR